VAGDACETSHTFVVGTAGGAFQQGSDLRAPGARIERRIFHHIVFDFCGVYGNTPKEAVIAAYAQIVHNDFNTWGYEKYEHLVLQGEMTVSCGECMCAMLPVDLTKAMLKRFHGKPE